jgi:hypothetical protein
MPLLGIVLVMPTLDLAMPTALLLVVTVALLLNKRVEGKLVATVEQKEFKTRDILLLIVFIAIMISVIAFTSMIDMGQVFNNILLLVFLSSYTMLLFTFSYVFSNLTRMRSQLLSVGFGIASLIAGLASFLGPLTDGFTIFRTIAFFALAAFCFSVVAYEAKKSVSTQRWYVAVQPPAMFVLLFVFFRIIYDGGAQIWYPLLMDLFGLTFAILIILYLSSMFSWKTVGLFAILLTVLDIILVFSGPMTAAAGTFTGLGLPVLVFLPNIPLIDPRPGFVDFFGYGVRGLGLGDFFFAGILAIQTYKKFGKKVAYTGIAAMVVAFGIWEAFLTEIIGWLNPVLSPITGNDIGGFPGTLMIISGWAPIVAWQLFVMRGKKAEPASQPAVEQLVTEQPVNKEFIK